jgi:signal transduction histidine kinase
LTTTLRAFLVVVSIGAQPFDAAWAASPQKQVLVLYATNRTAQIVAVGDRELPRMFDAGLAEGVDYYSEFIDQARYSHDDYYSAFRDFLRLKYEGHDFDLVVAMDSLSLEFMDSVRFEMFQNVPLVFFSDRPLRRRPSNSTGVVAELNLASTLDLVADLQPDVQHVFVVGGADRYDAIALQQFRPFEQRFSFTYLSGLPTKDLQRRLAALPAHSVVYYLVVTRDGAKENFNPLDYLDRIVAFANAPTYCWVDSAMDHGIVGGSLKSQPLEADTVGALALRVLQGEAASSIPVRSIDLNVREVDWRQLRRWGISEARVPSGTRIRFRELSAWERYKVYILASVGFMAAQTALIGGLIVHRSRRRRAEQQLRRSEANLRASFGRIRDLGSRLLKAQDAERSRLAAELHDDISQQLSVLEIDLRLLARDIHGPAAELASEVLNRARAVSASVRGLSRRLHPATLRQIGLVAAIEGLQREFSQSDIDVTFTHHDIPATLPRETTLCLFRVAQEGLQNAVKYSKARHVSVNLCGNQRRIALSIVDDGLGFDVQTIWGTGLGLITMSERVEALRGTLNIRSTPGRGTRLDAMVPVQSAAC